jgi:hypothetical protein
MESWTVVSHLTFGWLSKDYKELTETSEAFIYLTMTHVMLPRLAGTSQFGK